MNLGFKTKFKNGKKTLFEAKIIKGLLENGLATASDFNSDDINAPSVLPLLAVNNDTAKLHTFREDPLDRWKAGVPIHFAVGIRTKNYYRFAPVIPCTGSQKIEIIRADDVYPSDYNNQVFVHDFHSEQFNETFALAFKAKVDGRFLSLEEIYQLSKNDGFESPNEMFEWFGFESWSGKIIHWTSTRY